MVIIGLVMALDHGPLFHIHGLTPEHASGEGLHETLRVIGCVLFLTVGGVIMVIGLIRRWRDPNWRPDR
jgi:hypothetical protein